MADRYVIDKSTLTGIGDAVREMRGITDEIPVPDLREKILGIDTTPADALFLKEIVHETVAKAQLPALAHWSGIAFGNGVFVAVAKDQAGGVVDENALGLAAYSANGVEWEATTLPYSHGWTAVAFGAGKFIAVGELGAAYSTDGKTWTQLSMPTDSVWRYICYVGDKFIAATYLSINDDGGAPSKVIAYSSDGESWNTSNVPGYDMFGVAYANGKFVAAIYSRSDGKTLFCDSPDCATWGLIQNSVVRSSVHILGWGSTFAVFPADTSIPIGYSRDAATWTSDETIGAVAERAFLTQIDHYGSVMALISCDRGYIMCLIGSGRALLHGGIVDFDPAIHRFGFTDNGSRVVAIDIGDAESDSADPWDVVYVNDSGDVYSFSETRDWERDVIVDRRAETTLVDKADNKVSDEILADLLAALTADATAEAADILLGEIAYGKDGRIVGTAPCAGELTFSGTNAEKETHYTEEGCSLAVDPVKGMAFVTIQGGTNSGYEHIRFTAGELPSGVEMLKVNNPTSTSATTQCYYTAVFTGITGKVNVDAEIGAQNTSSDYVPVTITMTCAE